VESTSSDGQGINTNWQAEFHSMASLLGTKMIDQLVGDEQDPNMIVAKGGDDKIIGGKLEDTVLAGTGNDYVWGDRGNDTVWGGLGNDVIYGSVNNDELHGGRGDDWISGGKNDDLVSGGKGVDVLHGNTGDDIVKGGAGDDIVMGDAGNDILNGGGGSDVIKGGSGNDYILASSGNDSVSGGSGFDVLDFSQMKGSLTINLGKHTYDIGSGNAHSKGDVSGFELVVGSASGYDNVIGDRNANGFVAGEGGSVFRGGLGNDTLFGNDGADTMVITKKDLADGSSDRFVNFQMGVDKVDLRDIVKGHANPDADFRFITTFGDDGGKDTQVQAYVNKQWVNLINLVGVDGNDVGADHHKMTVHDFGILA
jgi:Ca2+-binding RTX toxin-like protein